MILSADSPNLIDGVRVAAVSRCGPDDRGYFLEVQRIGHGLAADFPPRPRRFRRRSIIPARSRRSTSICTRPIAGLRRWACSRWRWWICATARRPSAQRNTLYVGALRPWQILIPPGVAHGYKVIGDEPAMLVYMTDRFYNPDRRRPHLRTTIPASITIGKRSTNKHMKLLVTGGAGFIGSAFVRIVAVGDDDAATASSIWTS